MDGRDLLVIIMDIILIWLIICSVDAIQCHAKARALGYNCSYGIMQGCVLEKDGHKFLIEQLRTVEK